MTWVLSTLLFLCWCLVGWFWSDRNWWRRRNDALEAQLDQSLRQTEAVFAQAWRMVLERQREQGRHQENRDLN